MLSDPEVDARTAVLVLCGAFFLPHTIAKLRRIDRASVFFEKAGFRPAPAFVVLAAAMELIAAFGLISGLYPRTAAIAGTIVLAGAAFGVGRVHKPMWRWQHPGVEYMIFWSAIMLTAAFLA
jgi:putative oxidoreductase